ncbi:MAG: hypothetical protein ABIU77_16600 [Ferruginibacter sp.]
MIRKNPSVDVINDILRLTMEAYPASNFIKSLLFQYQERGGLSKKQLQDLHDKASKVANMPAGKLATLEAVILKKPTRYKSPMPVAAPAVIKDEKTGVYLNEILAKYPQHKMVLFLKSKYENDEVLSPTENGEIERLHKLLIK